MKVVASGCLALALLCACGANAWSVQDPQSSLLEFGPADKGNFSLCDTCVNFANHAIGDLLKAVVDGGVIGSCQKLCKAVAAKTGGLQPLSIACNFLCDYVGISEFVSIIKRADLDAIYMCEELRMCEAFDGGDAKIDELVVRPATIHRGDNVVVGFAWVSINGTGTGTLSLSIQTVDKIPIVQNELLMPVKGGYYSSSASLSTRSACDPTQKCEQWLPGVYQLTLAICNGECSSKHPHSQVYDTKTTNFTIA